MQFKIHKTNLKDAILIESFQANDERGQLIKDFKTSDFYEILGFHFQPKEIFYTNSKKGVIRALHFQDEPRAQSKIVRVIKGKIYDVIVDLREDSTTFLQWQGWYLEDDHPLSIFVPKGFAHGYLVLEDSIVSYITNEEFDSECDTGIIWNDKTIGINWPIDQVENLILSDRDKNLPSLNEYLGWVK